MSSIFIVEDRSRLIQPTRRIALKRWADELSMRPAGEARAHGQQVVGRPRADFASGNEASDFETKTQDKLDAGAAT
jgi:hypothetical protein